MANEPKPKPTFSSQDVWQEGNRVQWRWTPFAAFVPAVFAAHFAAAAFVPSYGDASGRLLSSTLGGRLAAVWTKGTDALAPPRPFRHEVHSPQEGPEQPEQPEQQQQQQQQQQDQGQERWHMLQEGWGEASGGMLRACGQRFRAVGRLSPRRRAERGDGPEFALPPATAVPGAEVGAEVGAGGGEPERSAREAMGAGDAAPVTTGDAETVTTTTTSPTTDAESASQGGDVAATGDEELEGLVGEIVDQMPSPAGSDGEDDPSRESSPSSQTDAPLPASPSEQQAEAEDPAAPLDANVVGLGELQQMQGELPSQGIRYPYDDSGDSDGDGDDTPSIKKAKRKDPSPRVTSSSSSREQRKPNPNPRSLKGW